MLGLRDKQDLLLENTKLQVKVEQGKCLGLVSKKKLKLVKNFFY